MGIAWRALSQVASKPAMRAPRIGSSGASPSQKKSRNGPSGSRVRSGSLRIRFEALEKM